MTGRGAFFVCRENRKVATHLRDGGEVTSVLIVDRELTLAADLASELTRAKTAAAPHPDVFAEADFSKARTLLRTTPHELLVTALKLGGYNGMHLVFVAAATGLPTRCVVHTDAVDAVQAREVRAAGAFYETRPRLRLALRSYVHAVLPSEDRRDPISFDRRRLTRGGRRAADSRPSR